MFNNIETFLAVLVQFHEEGKIETYCLSCRKVPDSHTSANIKLWFREEIENYEIADAQIIVLAADSAANIQKGARLFLEDLQGPLFFVGDPAYENSEDEDSDDEDDNPEATSACNIYEEESEDEDDDGIFSITNEPIDLHGLLPGRMIPSSYRVGCVVHQAQLAINKWCKHPTIEKMLKTARSAITFCKMRTQKVSRVLLRDYNMRAVIDQETRWSSKHKMTKRLAQLKDFYDDQSGPDGLLSMFKIHYNFWPLMNKFNKVLEPLSTLTTQLQDEQLSIPKFNECWIKADQDLEEIVTNLKWNLGKGLIKLLRDRRAAIGKNPIIMAGIFLNPRLWRQLSDDEQSKAKEVVESICAVTDDTDDESDVIEQQVDESQPAAPKSKFEQLVGSLSATGNESSQASPVQIERKTIKQQMQQYEEGEFNETITYATDPIAFWNKRAKNKDDPLYELAVVA